MEKDITRDLLTQQLLEKAPNAPALQSDFTARVLNQIEIETAVRKEKINEPLIPGFIWRRIGMTLSGITLLVLGLSVFTLVSWPTTFLRTLFSTQLTEVLPVNLNQVKYLPQLFLAGLICFSWLVLDYCYGRLKNT